MTKRPLDTKKDPRDQGLIQRRKKDGTIEWYARIVRRGPTGRKRQFLAKADNKTHARRLRDQLAQEYESGGEDAIDGSRMRFADVCDRFAERRLIPAQYHEHNGRSTKVAGLRSLTSNVHYCKVVKERFGARQLSSISYADLEDFRAARLMTPGRQGTRSIADVNRSLAMLRSIFKFAIQNGWVSRSPFERGPSLIHLSDEVRRERVLTLEEERALLTACEADRLVSYERYGRPITAKITTGRPLLRSLIITALDTALRKGELLKLRWRGVDFATGLLTILAVNSKTHRPRRIAMTARVREELIRLWDSSPQDVELPVFAISDFKKSFSAACEEAKIFDFRFHDLRHTAITRMVELGLPPMEIMKVSGHTQWNTFARYVNPGDKAIHRIAEVLSSYSSGYKPCGTESAHTSQPRLTHYRFD